MAKTTGAGIGIVTVIIAARAIGGVAGDIENDTLNRDKSWARGIRSYLGTTGRCQLLTGSSPGPPRAERYRGLPSDLESSSTEIGSYLGGRRLVASFDITMLTANAGSGRTTKEIKQSSTENLI